MEAESVRAVIAAVPAWRAASVSFRDVSAPVMSPMHRGVDSTCFALDVDGAALFLKVTHPECRAEVDVEAAFAAAASAASVGAAPRPHHCLAEHGAIVFERLDAPWRTARTDDLRRPEVMEAVIAAKGRVRSAGALTRTRSVFDDVRALSAGRDDGDLPFPADAVSRARSAVAAIEAALAAAGFDRGPCHADGLASNVMLGPGGAVRLVDFDRAGDADPHYDLGILLNEAYAFDGEMMPALEMAEGSARVTTLNRCRLYAVADDFFWALWAAGMAATSARTGIEFLKYAQWRFLRLTSALADPAFPQRLRAI